MKRTNIVKSVLVMGLLCLGISSSLAHEGRVCHADFWKSATVQDVEKLMWWDEVKNACGRSDDKSSGEVIHVAIENGSPSIVKEFLLRFWHNLDLDVEDAEGKTAFALAKETAGMEEVAMGLAVIPAKQRVFKDITETLAGKGCFVRVEEKANGERDVLCNMRIVQDMAYFLGWSGRELELLFFPNR